MTIQQPTTSQNYAIGCIADTWNLSKGRKNGDVQTHGDKAEPPNLYLAQLKARLGFKTVNNITTEE